jgi:hypothetical protein
LAREHQLADHRIGEPRLRRDGAGKIGNAVDDEPDRLVPAIGILDIALRSRLRRKRQHVRVEGRDRRPAFENLGALLGDPGGERRIDAVEHRFEAGIGLRPRFVELGLGIVDRLQHGLRIAARQADRAGRLEENAIGRGELARAVGGAQLRPGAHHLDE